MSSYPEAAQPLAEFSPRHEFFERNTIYIYCQINISKNLENTEFNT